jgi:hypothetical protein
MKPLPLNEQAANSGSALRRIPACDVFLGAAWVLAGLAAFGQWRSLASTRDRLELAAAQVISMTEDATHLRALRAAPLLAAGRSRGHEELLATVEKALAQSGIDRSRWQDSVPQPPGRIRGGAYTEHRTLLYFDALTLQELATFAFRLQAADSALFVTSLNLSNRQTESSAFVAEVGVSYRQFSPGANPDSLGDR